MNWYNKSIIIGSIDIFHIKFINCDLNRESWMIWEWHIKKGKTFISKTIQIAGKEKITKNLYDEFNDVHDLYTFIKG